MTTEGHAWWPLIHQAIHLQSLLACLHQSFSCHSSAIIGVTWIKAVAGTSTHMSDITAALFSSLIAVSKWCRINWPNNYLHNEPRAITTLHPVAPLPSPPCTSPARWPELPAQPRAAPGAQKPKASGARNRGTADREMGKEPECSSSPRH